jgi:hypothetical protein
MKTTAVNSRTLRTVAYDADRQILQLEFHSRTKYRYFQVPVDIYEGLLQAPSKGAYFNHFIRDNFDYCQIKAHSLS